LWEIDMRITIVAALLLLAGCGGSPNDPGVGGVTRGEAEALNDAAAMLDQTEPPPSVLNGAAEQPAQSTQ
jgi:hypothetical protein